MKRLINFFRMLPSLWKQTDREAILILQNTASDAECEFIIKMMKANLAGNEYQRKHDLFQQGKGPRPRCGNGLPRVDHPCVLSQQPIDPTVDNNKNL